MPAKHHQNFMLRALELARNGLGRVAPNPLVAAVIVHNDSIIGEGWHQQYGGPHAEVNAVNAVPADKRHLLPESTIYVNLEPCAHHGKTPPCADLIVSMGFKQVVVANTDPNPLVAGQGLEKIKQAGIAVTTGVLTEEGRELNKRFFTYHQQKRPYVVLKWGQTADGYISKSSSQQHWITGELSRKLVHKWRSHEPAIMVGTHTVWADNPRLDTRLWPGGKPPLRVTFDRTLKITPQFYLLDGSQPTLIVTEQLPEKNTIPGLEYVAIDYGADVLPQVLDVLYERGIQSVLVEGGAALLESFLSQNLWDEARVFVSPVFWGDGLKAPAIKTRPAQFEMVGNDRLYLFKNA